ncbi:MAG: GNAT family N-acetyltransferase [Actinomycetota bacterium]|nr:GNAT family N-acetyltransferase [Actinomycetota bacterium]
MQVRHLRASDATASFACGDAGLDRFLQRHAWQNQDALGIGVTYVATPGSEIAGYVTLAAGALERDVVPTDPVAAYPRYPLPFLRLARLAVDARVQGVGVGSALVDFALRVAWTMRGQVGYAGVAVDALPGAVDYYETLGFGQLAVLRGSSTARPRQIPMYLSLNKARPLLEID